MNDHKTETDVPPYKCGMKDVFPGQSKNDDKCVVKFTRFSIKPLFDINHDWDMEIVKL